MSRLSDLLKELCPNGVVYLELSQIATEMFRGAGIKRDDLSSDGIPCIRYGEIYTSYGVFFDRCISRVDPDKVPSKKALHKNDLLFAITGESVSDIGKCTAYIGEEEGLVGGDILVVRHLQDAKYLSYALSTTEAVRQKGRGKVKSKVVHASADSIGKIRIPVPPLEVQREIVRILDNFTELKAELTTKLTAELTARKKQYQFYLDSLFSSCLGETKCLSEIGTLVRGKRFVHADAVEDNGIPCVHYGELYTYYGPYATVAKSQIRRSILQEKKLRYAQPGDVIIVGAGENDEDIGVGVSWEGNGPVAVHDACYTFTTNLNPRFVSFFLRSSSYHQQIKKYVSTGKICSISAEGIGKAKLIVPSREEQNRIVSILEAFHSLTGEMESGIPAEIEARKKQYEYYRDHLLTFQEAK